MPKTAVVVPCYNEAGRLRGEVFEAFAKAHPDVCFVMVNDGSTDATLDLLQRLAARNADQFLVVDVQPNGGKAAAVRVGMQAAFELDTVYAGYWDGDLATPLDEIPRFVSLLDERPRSWTRDPIASTSSGRSSSRLTKRGISSSGVARSASQ